MPEIIEQDGVTFLVEDDDTTPLNQAEAEVSETESGSAEAEVDGELENDEEEDVGELSDEEADALEKDLDKWLERHLAEKVKAEVSRVQSTKDKEVQRRDKQIEDLTAKLNNVTKTMEEQRIAGLSDYEREEYLSGKELEDRRREVEEAAAEVDLIIKGQLVTSYIADYGKYGVDADDLESIEDPDEMERFCERAELKYYRDHGNRASEPEPQKPASKPVARTAPAGASAPTDLGGTSPELAPDRGKPAEGVGRDAMAKTLANMPFETVRL